MSEQPKTARAPRKPKAEEPATPEGEKPKRAPRKPKAEAEDPVEGEKPKRAPRKPKAEAKAAPPIAVRVGWSLGNLTIESLNYRGEFQLGKIDSSSSSVDVFLRGEGPLKFNSPPASVSLRDGTLTVTVGGGTACYGGISECEAVFTQIYAACK